MEAWFHGVVKDSANDQHLPIPTTDEEVSRSSNSHARAAGTTLRQMPGKNAVPQFWSVDMPNIVGTRSRVPDGRGDQRLIAIARIRTELLFRPRKNPHDIGLRRMS
nr:hypothetical protein [Cryobacterium glaciale]